MIISFNLFTQTVGIIVPVASLTYCAGTNITVNYTVSAAFGATNTFSTQLSDATGSFASPSLLGTRVASNSGGSSFLIPYTTPASSLYRVRIITSAPSYTSLSNGVDLRINGLGINTPTVSSTNFCQGETFTTTFSNINTCNFSNSGFNNVYTVELSDAFGSFATPLSIGTRTSNTSGAVTCTVPSSPAGTGYRVRIVSSNPVITSADNGVNITINATAGSPSVFGIGTWNAYCFNNFNNFTTNYQGYFTEDILNFDTRNRFTNTMSPSTATVGAGSTGAAYTGCAFGIGTNYSVSYKRTNIPCGYYQIDIPAHDDYAFIIINGTTVFVHNGCCDSHTNVWTGIISPSDNIEISYTNGGGPGYLAVNFIKLQPSVISPPVTICSGASATLSAAPVNTLTLNYAWTPTISVSPSTGSLVTVSPTTTTIYTVNVIDAGGTGCALFTNTVQVTVNPVPTTTIAATSTLICSGITQATLTAGGAASYTWSPASGLSSVTGFSVIASPTVNTTYTVSGSNYCSTINASTLIVVQNIPSAPSPTLFGNNIWNVYCYDGFSFTNYYGYYTENNLNFNSLTRWSTGSTPSLANASTGLPYSGCNIGVDNHSTSHKRTNFTCGYYQMDIPYHDDNVTVLVDGVMVFQHNGCCDAHINVWSGFLGPLSKVEIQHQEGGGGSSVAANFILIPYPVLSPPVTICAGTTTSLTASPFISGANYNWIPVSSLTVTATGTIVIASPTISTNYTCTVTDPVTTCSAAASVSVTVNPLPTTTVSPTTATISCAAQQYTLNAGGANTYSWSPAAGLSSTTGSSVTATPTITTTYTVSGNNNCATNDATTTITVIPLVSPFAFGNNIWNVYCYNDLTFTNYYGYYTENGSGATGYNFNTTTRWASGAAPSNANATNGAAYLGCPTSASNISLSFKRTNFVCNTYSINIPSHRDGVSLYINGSLVGSHTGGGGDSHSNIWVGPLSSSSTVEYKLTHGTGASDLSTTFSVSAATPSLCTWVGNTSTDWFTASNWCGSGVPNPTSDAYIAGSGPIYMPIINSTGAACRSLTLTSATTPVTISSALIPALPAASLTISGGNSLDLYGNWINNGYFSAGTSTVNVLGATSTSIAGTSTETFYNLVINKTGTVTVTVPSIKNIKISNSSLFTNSIVKQNGTLSFLNGATASGQSNSSFVDGEVIKYGTQSFIFPVGTGGNYRPISISAPALATDNFTAKYYLADPSPPYTYSAKDLTIDHISRCEFWILNRTGGSSNVNVTLSWNTTSCGVTSLSDLIVARWDAGQVKWKDQGNGGTTGTTASGSVITNGLVTNFSPFTLASISSSNPLPIGLISFNCSNLNKNTNSLSWVTATENNNDYFEIERSSDGFVFDIIGKQKGAGNSLSRLEYSFNDQNIMSGITYYRLKQVDFDGKFKYSKICDIENNNSGFTFYPNPVRNELIIDFGLTEKPQTNSISVTDISGQQILVHSTFNNSKVILDCSNLSEGIYFLKIIIGNKEVVNKFTVLK